MSARNIAGEKMGSFDKGMSGPKGEVGNPSRVKAGGKPVLLTAGRPLSPASRGKGSFGGKESKTTQGVPAPGKYKG
jgi:hypothetical protein